jgi:hypothetical protein
VKGGYAVASGLLTTIMKDGRGEERRDNRPSATNHLVASSAPRLPGRLRWIW